MSATPSLSLLEKAAGELAMAGQRDTANRIHDERLKLAALLDAADDKLAEIDRTTHGLADTTADRALRRAVADMRPKQ